MEFSRGYEKVRFRNNLRPYLGGLYEFGSYFPHTSLPAEYIYIDIQYQELWSLKLGSQGVGIRVNIFPFESRLCAFLLSCGALFRDKGYLQ